MVVSSICRDDDDKIVMAFVRSKHTVGGTCQTGCTPACEAVVQLACPTSTATRWHASSREARFDHHLVEPVDAGQLLALLDEKANAHA